MTKFYVITDDGINYATVGANFKPKNAVADALIDDTTGRPHPMDYVVIMDDIDEFGRSFKKPVIDKAAKKAFIAGKKAERDNNKAKQDQLRDLKTYFESFDKTDLTDIGDIQDCIDKIIQFLITK